MSVTKDIDRIGGLLRLLRLLDRRDARIRELELENARLRFEAHRDEMPTVVAQASNSRVHVHIHVDGQLVKRRRVLRGRAQRPDAFAQFVNDSRTVRAVRREMRRHPFRKPHQA